MFSQPYKLIQIQKSWYLVKQNFQISGSESTCRAVKIKFHSQLVKFWVTLVKYALIYHQYLKGFISLFQRNATCYNWRTDDSNQHHGFLLESSILFKKGSCCCNRLWHWIDQIYSFELIDFHGGRRTHRNILLKIWPMVHKKGSFA